MSINYKFNIGQLVRRSTWGEAYDGCIGRVVFRPKTKRECDGAWYGVKFEDGQEMLCVEEELERYVE